MDDKDHYAVACLYAEEARKQIANGLPAARVAGVDTLIALAQVHATLATRNQAR